MTLPSDSRLIQIVEGALLAAGRPLSTAQLAELFEEHERPDRATLDEAIGAVAERCEGRGYELRQVASGWRFQVRQDLAPWVGRLWHERPQKYSRALLETLALIAYRQPITRGEIEEIRGVAVSSTIIRTLQEREWVRVVGHRDVPGRPAMYATTRQFLDYFNLRSLDQLPALAEMRDLETLNAELGFAEPLGIDDGGPAGESAATGQSDSPELTAASNDATDAPGDEATDITDVSATASSRDAGPVTGRDSEQAPDGQDDGAATPPTAGSP